jgi:uncharacterized membrane protein
MKPLIVLILVFFMSVLATHFFSGTNITTSGNFAMFVMLLFTAIGHFKFTQGMIMMMPPVIPWKKEVVYATGFLEILLGTGLLFPGVRQAAGVALIIMFMVMLPANINGTIKRINLEKGSYDGPGTKYLWFRIPLQFFFIAWVFYFAI